MRLVRNIICGMAVVLWAACPPAGSNTTDAGTKKECETRAECAPGKVCTPEGRCAECQSSGECTLKEVCNPEKRLCELREGWGTVCAFNEDCSAGAWCKQGLCVARSLVSLCPLGLKTECATGFRCNTINSVCEEDLGCATSTDCSPAEICNVGNYTCVPRCTVDTQAQVCVAGEKCVQERCAQCAIDAECGPGLLCDKAGKCSSGARCYQDRDCQVPLFCHIPTGACLPKRPPCVSDEDCGTNLRCAVGLGKCVPKNCQKDAYEPNNDRSSAFGVSAGVYTSLTLCEGDVDYYSIALSRGDQIGINVDADPFSENTFSTVVQDTTGRTLAAGKLLATYVASATSTYFVSISSTDPYQPYDVTFLRSRGTPCDDDGYEPNDVSTQATAVNSAQQVEGVICPQDVDYFSIPVPAGKGLKVSLVNYVAAKGLLNMCVFDGTNSLGCSDDVAPSVTVPSGMAAGKTLRVKVAGSLERISNTYTLKVEFP